MMGHRTETRTWHPPTSPLPKVADPATVAIFRVISRALKMIVAEIDKRCGIEDDAGTT